MDPATEYMMSVWNASPGRSGIFNFPFRVYASEPLAAFEGKNDSHRYRITFIPKNLSNARRTVPFSVWPNFETAPSYSYPLPSEEAMIDLTYGAVKAGATGVKQSITDYYSQIRLDVWGIEPETELKEFCTSFFDLVALYTDQYWMNNYETNFNLSYITNIFPIDDLGRCTMFPKGEQKVWGHVFKPLNNQFTGAIFKKALMREEVDTYWKFYFEGCNLIVRSLYDQAVMILTLSIEMARNVIFQKFVLIKKQSAEGPIFEKPFDNTDLLKHLGTNLKAAINRSLEEEYPQIWEDIVKLYLARHQVAHGKKAAYKTNDGMRLATLDDLIRWSGAVRNTLAWLYNL